MRRPTLSVDKLSMAALVLAVLGTVACGSRLSSRSSAVLNQLGQAAGFTGANCSSGTSSQAMVDAYLEEIGRRPSDALSVTLPTFARRASGICPESRPTIRVSKAVDVSAVARILGRPMSETNGPIPLESWLRADVDQGKVVSLTLDLAKVSR